ncbi:hypothetical protein G6011_04209 [Alternaria panax]|uniref:Uncharacterized protein n=1 Tax=Alternaria panax TaxID=48097 RepID=A0AAD4IGP0_9PLEO|nr:hypothetical protein G6011_04209 [Alternaria panax]
MNWTGGSLQRTKKANRGVLQQQKAYFAKARTQLQNATDSPAAPFRPSYLRDNDDCGLWGITPSVSGSVRHTGHAAKRTGERRQRGPTTEKRRSTTNALGKFPHEQHSASPLRYSLPNSNVQLRIRKGSTDLRDVNRKALEMDMELQLLEVNRKRLLIQHDWVGIDPLKPVSLQFQSSREKSKIGKRRRTTRGHGAAPRRENNDGFRDEDLHLANNDFADMLGRNGPHQDVDNIRIRIGTDAMTNTYSTYLNHYAQSHASSELMLFDQEEAPAQRRLERPPVNLQLHAATTL